MNIFIYSDESGVFDRVHNQHFVYGGIVFLDRGERDTCTRKFSAAESNVRMSEKRDSSEELKASKISNKSKNKLYKLLHPYYKFGIVIQQQRVLERIFLSKKDKQRYLDYAYKIGVKRFLEHLIKHEAIISDEVENMYFFVDEHTTATNGRYELHQALEKEYKYGTYNNNYTKYFPPLFPNLKSLNVEFCDSSSKILVRSADIIANHIYYLAESNKLCKEAEQDLFIIYQP